VLRFAGFELDLERVELRGPDGEAIKLRPQTFAMLTLFAANAGRVLSKQELMEAVWPNVHVGDDSLFKCVRELRTALGDDRRQLIKLVSGHGYRLDAEVTNEPVTSEPAGGAEVGVAELPSVAAAELTKARWSPFLRRGPAVFAAVAGLGAVFGLAIAAPIFGPDLIFPKPTPTIAVMTIADASNDSLGAAMVAGLTDRLIDGLAKIDNVRVVARPSAAASAKPVSAPAVAADFVVTGELRKDEQAWTLQVRMTKTATQEVQPAASISVNVIDSDPQLQQLRLAAGVGHQLALRINTLLNAAAADTPPASAKAAIEQATASIMQTTRDRFAAAQAMLEKSLVDHPDNVDIQVALAALQLRGIQLVWYSPADAAAVEKNAKAMLERAVRTRPSSIPVLEAYCRFLNATNEFVESLVVCARTLAFDPWDGTALYHMGLSQLPLGRFEDALATFKQADRFDTPPVSRWTWLLGAGVSYLMMGRDEEALPWLQRSIAITPASGRPLVLLAAAYQRLGRTDEAHAALTQGLKLRPGSTVSNIGIPTKNVSAAYMEARGRIEQALIAAGLPER
jgi:DNA-binding winged helix-turn-helix (wHTH) protein/tetratricopeptide (TPR) repeat protein